MKKFFALFFALTTAFFAAKAQIINPVHWTWKAEQTGKGEYKLIFTAKIDKGFHTYSQYIGDGGPVPTQFTFDSKNKDVQVVGKTTESGPKVHDEFEKLFNMRVKYFDDEMICTQILKVKKDTKFGGTVNYMACNNSSCTPPTDVDFEFDLKANGKAEPIDNPETKNQGGSIKDQKAFNDSVQAAIQKAMAGDTSKPSLASNNVAGGNSGNKYGTPIGNCNTASVKTTDKSVWAIIALGFLGGLIALLTPCVFPHARIRKYFIHPMQRC